MAFSAAGSPSGFQEGLIAGSHAVKTPAIDRRSVFDRQTHRVDAFDLGCDRGGNVFGECDFIISRTVNEASGIGLSAAAVGSEWDGGAMSRCLTD